LSVIAMVSPARRTCHMATCVARQPPLERLRGVLAVANADSDFTRSISDVQASTGSQCEVNFLHSDRGCRPGGLREFHNPNTFRWKCL
jgi:hypothetical protein